MYRMNEDVYVSPNVWKIFTISYMHYCTIGTVVGIVVGLAVSYLFPTNQNIDPKLLTPFVRRLNYHNNRAKSKGTSTAEEYITAAFQDTRLWHSMTWNRLQRKLQHLSYWTENVPIFNLLPFIMQIPRMY